MSSPWASSFIRALSKLFFPVVLDNMGAQPSESDLSKKLSMGGRKLSFFGNLKLWAHDVFKTPTMMILGRECGMPWSFVLTTSNDTM